MIRKVKGGYTIVHCSGKSKGKRIKSAKKPRSKKKVLAQHRAIMANKKKKRLSFKKKKG